MIELPQIVQVAAQHAAVIRFTIPRAEIRNVMRPAMEELVATVRAQAVGPAGPIFSHHFRIDPSIFDFEVGVPVTSPVSAKGRVAPGRLPAATVARTVYQGAYEGLGPAWGEFDAWIVAQGYTPAPDLWERYIAGPESSPDPATWRTELDRSFISMPSTPISREAHAR
jgi:effector-binding domain-containing protein